MWELLLCLILTSWLLSLRNWMLLLTDWLLLFKRLEHCIRNRLVNLIYTDLSIPQFPIIFFLLFQAIKGLTTIIPFLILNRTASSNNFCMKFQFFNYLIFFKLQFLSDFEPLLQTEKLLLEDLLLLFKFFLYFCDFFFKFCS
jgi:hypothetical protein